MSDEQRREIDEALLILVRWLAHKFGPQEQYEKMRQARDLLTSALSR